MNSNDRMGCTHHLAKSSKPEQEGPVRLSEVSETTGTKSPGYMTKVHCFSWEISIDKVEVSLQNAHVTFPVENITPLPRFNMNLKIDTLKKEANPEI